MNILYKLIDYVTANFIRELDAPFPYRPNEFLTIDGVLYKIIEVSHDYTEGGLFHTLSVKEVK